MSFATGWLVLSLLLAGGAPAAEVTEIPFEFVGHHTFIDVRLSGETLSFVFDTGAGGVALNAVTAERMGIRGPGRGQARGAGGTIQVPIARGLTLQVGDLRLSGVAAGILPMVHLEEYVGRRLDGIIGRDIMRGRVVVLDHDRNVIEVHRRRGFSFGSWGAPCRIKRNGPLTVDGKIGFLDGTTVPGGLHVDTGAAMFLSLNAPFAVEHALGERTGLTYARSGKALTGVLIDSRIGRVRSIGFCGYEFPGPETPGEGIPVSLSLATAGVQAGTDAAGLLGNAVLRRFNLAFDIAGHRMYLRPNLHWSAPIRADASGLRLIRRDGAVLIDQVVRDSPGAETGLAPGDRIVSIDGIGISALTLAEWRERLEQPGRRFGIKIDRDGHSRNVSLHSRSLSSLASAPIPADFGSAADRPNPSGHSSQSEYSDRLLVQSWPEAHWCHAKT